MQSRRPIALQVLFWTFLVAFPGIAQAPPARNVNALIHAIRWRDLARVKTILDSGMDLNVADENGVTPLGEAISNQLPTLAIEMIRRGADVNLTSIGWSPLMCVASSCSNKDVVLALVERGAVVDARAPGGDTALIIASASCKDGRIVHALLKGGANPIASDENGDTALIAAAQRGNARAVEALIAAGVDLNAANREGETALSIAREHPFRSNAHDRIYAMLLKAGAR